jgi:hypothetical protein
MKPIQAAELSAYLDGELDSHRAAEVKVALASDPALQAEYECLTQADTAWKAAAHTAKFEPKATVVGNKTFLGSPLALAAIIVLAVASRFALELSDVIVWGLILHSTAMALVLPWVIHMAHDDQNQL